MNNNIWSLRGIIFLVVISLLGCDKEDPVVPEIVTGELDPNYLGFDLTEEIVLYNGISKTINNGTLSIGDEVFQINTTDSKLSVGSEYSLSFNGKDMRFFYTELPIVSITTGGVRIVDNPKVGGKIYLLENGSNAKSYNIGIELRGGVSQEYPKKSYSVELWKDPNGTDTEKKPLLGMRDDDDWVLDGQWNEPIRVRDFTSHAIWLKIGRIQQQVPDAKIGIDRKYCELFINGKYQGVYYLGEKIDRKQLQIEKFTIQLEGELYKGYTWADGVTFDGVEDFDNNSSKWSGYEIKYPDNSDRTDWTNLHAFVDFIVNSSTTDFNNNIPAMMDLDNASDYYIFMNLLYAADNRGKNVYTARINSSSPYFFAPWDMDSSFGNNQNGDRIDITDQMLSNGLYDRLLEFPGFTTRVKERWNVLRNTSLASASIKKQFRDNYEYLDQNGVYNREAVVPEMAFNYSDSEIDFIESWIDRRTAFLDSYFNGL